MSAPDRTPEASAADRRARRRRRRRLRRRSFLKSVYGGLPRRVYWLGLGVFLNRAGFFAVPMLVIFMTSALGFAEKTAGLLLAVYAGGALISAVAGGLMTDSLGRRPTMLISLLGAGVLWLGVIWAEQPWTLAVLLFATGFLSDLYRAAGSSMIADLCTAAQRSRAYAFNRTCGNAGMAIGPALAGLLADRSFILVFAGESLTCLLFGLVILFKLPETREHEHRISRAFTGIGQVFTDRGFLLVCFANLLVTSVYTQQLVTLPLFVRVERGLTLTDHGLLLSLNGLLIVTLEMLVVARTRRVPPLFAIAVGSALMGLGFGALPLTAGLGGMALCAAVWTFGEMVAWPVMPVWIVSRAPNELRGRYLGVIGLFTGISLLLGATGGTWLVEHYGQDVLWRTCFWVCQAAALAVLLLALGERMRRRREQARSPGAG